MKQKNERKIVRKSKTEKFFDKIREDARPKGILSSFSIALKELYSDYPLPSEYLLFKDNSLLEMLNKGDKNE